MVDQLLASDVSFEEEQQQAITIPSAATGVLGMVGIAERGPLKATICQGFPEWQKIYGGFTGNSDAVLAVKGFFENGGAELHFVRAVHCTSASDPTTKTSSQATLTLNTAAAAATAGSAQSANTAPWLLTPGDTLIAKIDGGGALTATFNATAASRTAANGGPYALVNGQTLQVAIDGGATQTISFLTAEFVAIGAATVAECAAVLNAYFAANGIGALADDDGTGKLRITSNRKGTGSGVNVVGGTSNATIGFVTGALAGTGNVSSIKAVTSAEAIAIAAAAFAGATVTAPGGRLTATSNTTGGGSSVQITGASTSLAEFGFDSAVHQGGAGGTQGTLQVQGKTDGAYANGITVIAGPATSGDAAHYNLLVLLNGATIERWPNLSMSVGAADYCVDVVNDPNTGSDYITLTDLASTLPSPQNLPNSGTFGPLTGGSDGLVALADADFVGGESVNGTTGLRSLDDVLTLSLVCVPGRATAAVQNAIVTYCEITRNGGCFAVLDPPRNQSAPQIVTYVKSTAALQRLSEYAAIYWPNILVDNPSRAVYGTAATIVAPPSGHVAGMFARVDASRSSGVWQAPAGESLGVLFGVRGVEMREVLKKPKREIVFPELINPIRQPENGGAWYVDGARTLKDTGQFPTIGQRRGVIFLEASLRAGLSPVRHRNITDRLLDECRNAAFEFLSTEARNGAFATTDPALAFNVDFGPGLNTAATRKARSVVGRVGVATTTPAEFIRIKVGQDTRALDAELSQLAAA